MFPKRVKIRMSVLAAVLAIAASWAYISLWHPKKVLGAQSFTNSVGMVMAKIPAFALAKTDDAIFGNG